MASMRDGLGGEEVAPSGLQAGAKNISPFWTGSITSASDISGANLYSNGVVESTSVTASATITCEDLVANDTVSDSDGQLFSTSVGSGTAVYGANIQAGSWALGAGSDTWIVYPTAYTGNPIVNITNLTGIDDNELCVIAGSINTGSAYVQGEAASDEFSWIAIGI